MLIKNPLTKQNAPFVISIAVGLAFLAALITRSAPIIDGDLWRKAAVPFVLVGSIALAFAIIVPWRLKKKNQADAAKWTQVLENNVETPNEKQNEKE